METFKKVYFRIEAGYKWGKGMDEESYNKFEEELASIFPKLGFSLKRERILSSSPEYIRGHERLYCHPMDLGGELLPETIEKVEKAIQNRKTFKFCQTDIYGTSYLYSHNELVDLLEEKREKVEKDLLGCFKTKRKNRFYFSYTLLQFIEDFKELSCIDKGQKDFVSGFIQGVFLDLIKKNKIDEKETEKGIKVYRTT